MRVYKTVKQLLFKPIEFILVLLITIFVSPLIVLVYTLGIAEKLKQRNRRKQWSNKVRKSPKGNRNNPVMWG
jgi:hypothetical protein